MKTIEFKTRDGIPCRARPLCADDADHLIGFGSRLSERSKLLFCPYPWGDPDRLRQSVEQAIKNSVDGTDASFLVFGPDQQAIGHFFLWKAGGNAVSKRNGVQVPELGIALADEYHGRALGLQMVAHLQGVAEDMGNHGIELTTASENDAAWKLYAKAGFEYMGMIQNPLEVDVTEAAAGSAVALNFRKERQMAYVINGSHRADVLEYLKGKRDAFEAYARAATRNRAIAK